MKNNNVMVLFSGGIDSTACVKYFLNNKIIPIGLFVDYGQLAAQKEHFASKKIAEYFNIPFKRIVITNSKKFGNGLIMGRNAFLLTLGLMNFDFENGLIALGIHSGTNYKDCNSSFISKMQDIFDEYTDGRIIISAPFIEFVKPEIWHYCKQNKLPLDLTYSCELGKDQPCGECLSCKDLEELNGTKKSNY